ncbi:MULTISPECIES: ATP-dependent endonuclease [unclassified Pantoea]|uniref:ATP-dependent nuclease n=1 Tax=unclassified Pantoea TaxID=2630326 RepID=UPI0023DC4D7B|nr:MULTISPECIES: ATP-dependent endonuclease [unclassified Pantoea]MDF2042833.1 ATP-dependent endonuclease [Pantoea sp. Cr_R14]MDF2069246.1 ATP-dependent endonuclease [Pantoea sp. Cr_R13]MDF2081172.1 ATP-dependent endonuclease [Pantoea sp. Cr_R21]
MILEHIDIRGFRGINKLSLPLTHTTLLIGENAWGKSSLLDVMSLLLSPHEPAYVFTEADFHFTPGDVTDPMRRISVVFHFRDDGSDPDAVLSTFWQRDAQGQRRLYYSVSATWRDGGIDTRRRFVDVNAQLLPEQNCADAIDLLLKRYPVLRLRDARFSKRTRNRAPVTGPHPELLAGMETLARDLEQHPQQLSDEVLRQGLKTMQQLMQHYFLVQPPGAGSEARSRDPQMRDGVQGWRALDHLNQLIAGTDSRSRQLILLQMFTLLIEARGDVPLAAGARPLLLIEDPETRLHPIMLSVAWNLLKLLPLQKIVTTNSAELLSQVSVENVCRLVRQSSRVAAWRIGPEGLSAEESRRIGFHIRVNRPAALFARCWLLVEGETEVWIMNELAQQCGYNFAAEGVKVIEFAQSGLKPLLKFARRMGIAWHVLTDGDQAGNKYASTARTQLQPGDPEPRFLTQLPALDMENFLYHQGFQDVYHQMAHLPLNAPMSSRRIITKAIHQSSKPELAIAVATSAAERGPEAIPPLMRQMFARVIGLAQGQAD